MKTFLTIIFLFISFIVNAKTAIWGNTGDSITEFIENGYEIKEIILFSKSVYHYHLVSPGGSYPANPVLCVVFSLPQNPTATDNCYVEVPQE